MADLLVYTNLFIRIRELVRYFFLLEEYSEGTGNTIPPVPLYIRNKLQDIFEVQGELDQIETVEADVASYRSSVDSLKGQLLLYFENLLAELGTELEVADPTDTGAVLTALADAMITDSETIRYRTIGISADDNVEAAAAITDEGSIEPHIDNTGDGTLVASFRHPELPDLTPSEQSFEEWLKVECTSAGAAGSESFDVTGGAAAGRLDPDQGSGPGPSLTVGYEDLITNGDFENWTGDDLDTWTFSGTWGVAGNAEKEATIKHKGSYGIEYNAGEANTTLKQAVSLSENSVYAIGFWARKTNTATGDLYVELVDADGTVLTDTEGDNIQYTQVVADLTEAFVFKYFTFAVRSFAAGTTPYLQVRIDTLATEDCFIDNLQFTQMVVHNSVYWALFEGATNFAIGDKFGYGGDTIGINFTVPAVATVETCETDGIVLGWGEDPYIYFFFTGVDKTASFPVGAYVQHPLDLTWHRITASGTADYANDGAPNDTRITVTPRAYTYWDDDDLQAFKHGRIQEFLGRCYNFQLPSDASPTEEDP